MLLLTGWPRPSLPRPLRRRWSKLFDDLGIDGRRRPTTSKQGWIASTPTVMRSWPSTRCSSRCPTRATTACATATAFSLSAAGRTAIDEWHAAGRPILALHTGVICFDDWPGWGELLGGRWDWNRSSHPPLGRVGVCTRWRRLRRRRRVLPGPRPRPGRRRRGHQRRRPSARLGATTAPVRGRRPARPRRPIARPPRPPTPAHRSRPTAAGAPPMTMHTVTTHAQAIEVFRNRNLRQALYDAGDVVMADVLVNLHGDAHRDRRRLENRLYRRETLLEYERELFPGILEDTLAPHVERGHAELVSLGHQLMMNLAAFTAGVDRPLGTPEETDRLYEYLRVFIEGATLAHYTGDKAAKRAEVEAALESTSTPSSSRPSIDRRAGARRRRPAPRRAHRAARQRGRPPPAARGDPAGDRLLPPRRRAHVRHRVHPSPPQHVRVVRRPPRGPGPVHRPRLRPAMHERDDPSRAVEPDRPAPRRRVR